MIRCLRTARSARSRPVSVRIASLRSPALDEPLRLEPLQHLAGRGARDAEHLGDARGERRQRRARAGGTRRSGTRGSRSSRGIRRRSVPAAISRPSYRARDPGSYASRWERSSTPCGSSATSSPPSAGSSSRSRSASTSSGSCLRAWAWRTILCASYPGAADQVPQRLRRLRRRCRDQLDRARAGGRRGQALPDQAPDRGLELRDAHADAGRRDALRRVRRRRRSSSGRSSIGVLPTHQVYSRLPSVDWGFFVKHAQVDRDRARRCSPGRS